MAAGKRRCPLIYCGVGVVGEDGQRSGTVRSSLTEVVAPRTHAEGQRDRRAIRMDQRDLEVGVVCVGQAEAQLDRADVAGIGHHERNVECLVVDDRKGLVTGELLRHLRPSFDRDVDATDRTLGGPLDDHLVAGQECLPTVRCREGEAPLHLLDVEEDGVEARKAAGGGCCPYALHAVDLGRPIE